MSRTLTATGTSLTRAVVVGAVAGVLASLVMGLYAMGAAWAKDVGFFTPLHHIASLLVPPDAMMASMQAAGTGSGFHLELGTAALGALVHMTTGAMYGVVFGVAVSRLHLGVLLLTAAGLGYGVLVFLGSAFVGLPVAAALLGSGDQITNMAQMAGWGTFLIEHLLFGLVLGALAAVGLNRPAPVRESVAH